MLEEGSQRQSSKHRGNGCTVALGQSEASFMNSKIEKLLLNSTFAARELLLLPDDGGSRNSYKQTGKRQSLHLPSSPAWLLPTSQSPGSTATGQQGRASFKARDTFGLPPDPTTFSVFNCNSLEVSLRHTKTGLDSAEKVFGQTGDIHYRPRQETW